MSELTQTKQNGEHSRSPTDGTERWIFTCRPQPGAEEVRDNARKIVLDAGLDACSYIVHWCGWLPSVVTICFDEPPAAVRQALLGLWSEYEQSIVPEAVLGHLSDRHRRYRDKRIGPGCERRTIVFTGLRPINERN